MKILPIIVCYLIVSAGGGRGELSVPAGASVGVPVTQVVTQAVPVVKIEVSEIRWVMPAGTNGLPIPKCIVTKMYTDATGNIKTVTKLVPLVKVDTYLKAQGSSLSNVFSVLAGAVQLDTNDEFSGL